MVYQHLEVLTDTAARVARNGSSSQWAYEVIVSAILARSLQSGQRLAEIPVAKAIGLGRTPVREALTRLESDGFVTSEPHTGLVVAGNTLESLAEIFEVREVLEAFACRLAARYAREADIVAIDRVLEESEQPTATHDVARLRALNTLFHATVHAASHNQQLRQTLRQLYNRVRLSPMSAYSVPGRAEEAFQEHRDILEAVRSRSEERAETLAREHHRRDKELRLRQMAGLDGASGSMRQ